MPHNLPKYVRVKQARGRTYYYFDTGQRNDAGKPILVPLPDRKDLDFSRAVVAAQNARNRRQAVPTAMTLAGLIDLYEKSPGFRNLAPATQTQYHVYLRRLRELMGGAPASDIDSADVLLLRDKLAATTGAANAIVRTLGALYKWGRSAGHVKITPTHDVELFAANEHEPWPEWLLEMALSDEDPIIRRSVALLYYTAQRIGDVCRMRWSDIRHGRIEMVQQKTRKAMTIPVHGELQAVLDEEPAAALTLLSNAGKPLDPPALRRRLQIWAKANGAKVVPHGLRKNAVNALLEAGCSTAETAAISGQTLQMIEHYAKQRDRKHLASAAILRWEQAKNKSGNGKQK